MCVGSGIVSVHTYNSLQVPEKLVSSTPHYAMQAKPSPSGSVIGKSKQPESILVPVTSLQRHNRCVDFVTIYISKVF